MSKYTYQDDGLAKKLVRFELWTVLSEILGERFMQGRHLVLSSHEAGDVSTLLGLGVPPNHIVAVDTDRGALACAKKKFPEVDFRHADITEVAKTHQHKFLTAHVDLCSTISEDTIKTIVGTLPALRNNSFLGIAFMMGREKEDAASRIEREKNKIARKREHGKDDATRGYNVNRMARIRVLASRLDGICASNRIAIRPMWAKFYLSGGKKRKGVPMAYTLFSVVRATKKEPFGAFIDRVRKTESEWIPSTTLAGSLSNDPWYLNIDEKALRDFCLRMNKSAAQISLLLNIPKMRVAAWKAHRTMGTY
jgi:hypothetical protein